MCVVTLVHAACYLKDMLVLKGTKWKWCTLNLPSIVNCEYVNIVQSWYFNIHLACISCPEDWWYIWALTTGNTKITIVFLNSLIFGDNGHVILDTQVSQRRNFGSLVWCFLQAGFPSCYQINNVKILKEVGEQWQWVMLSVTVSNCNVCVCRMLWVMTLVRSWRLHWITPLTTLCRTHVSLVQLNPSVRHWEVIILSL